MSSLQFHHRLYLFLFLICLLVFYINIAEAQDVEDPSLLPTVIDEPASEVSDDFFDAGDLVPQSQQSQDGPNPVNPRLQPASKFIVVRQNAKVDSQVAQLVAAERALTLGRNESALQLFDVLYEANNKDSRVLMGRAVALQKIGRFDEAMSMYEAVSKVDPENVDVQVNMLGLLSTRYPAIALRKMLDLYAKHSDHAGLTAQLAVAYAQTGDVNMALRYLGAAASMEPYNANHLFNYAVIADRAGRAKEAVQYYERSLEVDTLHGGSRTIPREAVYDRLAQIR